MRDEAAEPSAGFEPQLPEDAFTLFVERVHGDLVGLETGAQLGELLHQSSLIGLADGLTVGRGGLTLLPLFGLFLLTSPFPRSFLETLLASFGHLVAAARQRDRGLATLTVSWRPSISLPLRPEMALVA